MICCLNLSSYASSAVSSNAVMDDGVECRVYHVYARDIVCCVGVALSCGGGVGPMQGWGGSHGKLGGEFEAGGARPGMSKEDACKRQVVVPADHLRTTM